MTPRLHIPISREGHYPGQVPTHEIIEGQTKPEPITMATLLEPDPILDPRKVGEGLGLSLQDERDWGHFLARAVGSAPNEVVLRRIVVEKSQGLETEARQVLLKRSVRYWRSIRKSQTEVVDLRKAEARGGKYHRRIPQPGGEFRYIYDEEQYKQRKDAHLAGPEAEHGRIVGKLQKVIDQAGGAGIHISELKALVQKFGAEKLSRALQSQIEKGSWRYDRGRFVANRRPNNATNSK